MSFCQTFDKRLSNSPFLAKICLFKKSVIVKVAFILLSFEFCSNLLCILPKFAIFAKICYPRKNILLPTGRSPCNRPFFAISFEFLASHSLLLAKFAILTKFVIFVKIANSQHASFVFSFHICQTLWIVAKFAISVIIGICKYAPFYHLFCQLFKNFCQTFDGFLPNLSLFSSHLNIWPNLWWAFGVLDIFAEICLYCLNLPFSYNCYLYKMLIFLFSFKFC